MNQDKKPITLEDLLRLKKAERPPAEFWARFDAEMHAKQLAAIVTKRPWWDGISRGFAVVSRNQLPFGAVAALAVTWAGFHYMGGPADRVHVVQLTGVEATREAPVHTQGASVVTHPSLPVEVVRVETRVAASSQAPVVVSNASHVSQMSAVAPVESPSRSPFSNVIAVTLADFREANVDRHDAFGSDSEFEPVMAAVRQPVADPLARLDPVSEERRSRLLAGALPSYDAAASRSPATERIADRVSNDRMYESMDPYESSGGMSLEFKF
jgi:hypothetical protein